VVGARERSIMTYDSANVQMKPRVVEVERVAFN